MNATPYPDPRPAATRRGFLKASAAVTGSTLIGSLGIAENAHAAGAGVLRVGLIGCGGRGTQAAVNAMNAGADIRLVSMAELFRDRLAACLERLRTA